MRDTCRIYQLTQYLCASLARTSLVTWCMSVVNTDRNLVSDVRVTLSECMPVGISSSFTGYLPVTYGPDVIVFSRVSSLIISSSKCSKNLSLVWRTIVKIRSKFHLYRRPFVTRVSKSFTILLWESSILKFLCVLLKTSGRLQVLQFLGSNFRKFFSGSMTTGSSY